MPAPPAAGDSAPGITLPATPGGDPRTRSDAWADDPVVPDLDPQDATPGCTTVACDFRDRHADLLAPDRTVIGVSPDPPASHEKFAAKQDLPFTLLSDESHAAAEAYGVWVEKSVYGKNF